MKHADLSSLLRPSPPWLLQVTASHSDVDDVLLNLERTSSGFIVRFLRGSKMTTTDGLYDEFAAALQFPYYFGFNGGAFDDCLTDLGWLRAEGYVVVIFDAHDFLAREKDCTQLDLFLDSLERACESWSKAIQRGEAWDRAAKPFHFVFHCTMENQRGLASRMAALPSLVL